MATQESIRTRVEDLAATYERTDDELHEGAEVAETLRALLREHDRAEVHRAPTVNHAERDTDEVSPDKPLTEERARRMTSGDLLALSMSTTYVLTVTDMLGGSVENLEFIEKANRIATGELGRRIDG